MFELILGLLCWGCNEMSGGSSDGSFSSMSSGDYWAGHSSFDGGKASLRNDKNRDSFEESDSVYDKRGNEHILDDDGYCEDCDDYHDDW